MKTTYLLIVNVPVLCKGGYSIEDLSNECKFKAKRIYLNGRFAVRGQKTFCIEPMLKTSKIQYELRGKCLYVYEEEAQ